jgi:hypothetical protein
MEIDFLKKWEIYHTQKEKNNFSSHKCKSKEEEVKIYSGARGNLKVIKENEKVL